MAFLCMQPFSFFVSLDCTGECLKISFRQMCVTICGRFVPDEGGAAGCVDQIRGKSPAKWDVQMAEMNFQPHAGLICYNKVK
ncbi:DUF6783 domain-containing protein [Clostridium sp. MCC353]|uniref:DUF6783 domain-containing protein n=1 Tax=Clostridium sp. MCC353 TaxID=2592646 RepID=UPI0031FE7999